MTEVQPKSNNAISTVLLVILAILLPPLAVFLGEDGINGHFWLNIVLCIFFWVPGVLHALWCVLRPRETAEL